MSDSVTRSPCCITSKVHFYLIHLVQLRFLLMVYSGRKFVTVQKKLGNNG